MFSFSPSFPSRSPCLATVYVRGFGLLGLGTAVAFGVGAATTSNLELGLWAIFGFLLAVGAAYQLRRRRPDVGRLIAVLSLGVIPISLLSSGGQFPAMVATGSLMAVAVVLVESDRRRTVLRLGIVYLSVATATLLNARTIGGSGRLVEAFVGAAVLGLAFAVTYLLFLTSSRVAEYDRHLHRALFDSAGDGVVVVDADGVIVRANPAAEEIFGFDHEEMTGRSVSELLPPAYRERHERFVAATMAAEVGTSAMRDRPPLTALRSWGETFPAEISVETFDVLGHRMAAATVRDISRRVAAEETAQERLDQLRSLYEGVPIGLYRSAPDGRILGGNPAFVSLLGAESEEELLRLPAQSFFVDPEERVRLLENVGRDAATAVFQIKTLDGRRLWVRDRTRAILDDQGRVVAYEGAVEDVTARVEAVAALEASNRAKQRLISAVAHNLRTPLTVILGYADLLGRSEAREDAAELAEIVRDHAHELAALIDELLIASRLDGDELAVMSVDGLSVDESLAEAVKILGAGALRDRLDLRPTDLTVRGDPLRLRQALQLMVSVATRDAAGPVRVEAETRDDDPTVRVVVSYEGEPVPEPDRGRLFEPFASGSADDANPNRLGVGLWAARRLASCMGGDLVYEHRDGRHRYVILLDRADAGSEGVSVGSHVGSSD